jgi:hypothetical protein
MEFFVVYVATVIIALAVFLLRELHKYNWHPREVPTQDYMTSVAIALLPVFNIVGVFIALICIIEVALNRLTGDE